MPNNITNLRWIQDMAKRYEYKDAKSGTKYCAHTNTGSVGVESGEALREQILDSGDYSGQLRDTDDGPYWAKVLPIKALGTSRI